VELKEVINTDFNSKPHFMQGLEPLWVPTFSRSKIRRWPSCLLLSSEMAEWKCSVKQLFLIQTWTEATTTERVIMYYSYVIRNGSCLSYLLQTWHLPYILDSNPHPFYSFRGLKNQMRIRIACGLDSRSRAGFWKKW